MSSQPKALQKLTEMFERLPGIGPKSAQRLAYHILHAPKEKAEEFARSIIEVKEKIRLCNQCYNVSDSDLCGICIDDRRDKTVILVIEDPLDIPSYEKAEYKGIYHVLHGSISPMQNIGPDQLYIRQLVTRLAQHPDVTELILGTNPTLEGEATAMYIQRLIGDSVKITRIARGLPEGSSIEYADGVTLRMALEGRNRL